MDKGKYVITFGTYASIPILFLAIWGFIDIVNKLFGG